MKNRLTNMMNVYEYYKNKLNHQAQQIYEGLLANIRSLAFEGFAVLQGKYDDAVFKDAKQAYKALRLDRPEYFFLGHRFNIRYSSNGDLTIRHQMKYSKNHILRINRIMRNTVKELLKDIKSLSDKEKEKKIYLSVGSTYEYKNGPYSHDLVGILVFKNGVCESLASMLAVLLREAGIPSIVVTGIGKRERHRWNKVWIDNTEYNLDVTWDMHNCKFGLDLKYYNLTNNQMARDHQQVDFCTGRPVREER